VSLLLVVTCDGLWPKPGRERCPAFRPMLASIRAGEAYERLMAEGWESGVDRQLCPAHARARREDRLDAEGRVRAEEVAGA
jgi:hypothetical protein